MEKECRRDGNENVGFAVNRFSVFKYNLSDPHNLHNRELTISCFLYAAVHFNTTNRLLQSSEAGKKDGCKTIWL